MNSRAQMGFIGEDLISLLVIVLALAGFFVFINTLFSVHVTGNAESDVYRRTWMLADFLSTEWAYTDSYNVTHARLLDTEKTCSQCPSIPELNLSISVKDLRENKTLCTCGPPVEGKTARLPTALRYNNTNTHPGILEVKATR
ncbi:MAG: hypothetical protein JW778_07060 [Candidatus Altiarchaeota archaeon]|nr:hypothetical protein [Candidatus Altiarchaeota archaeon]